MLLMYSILNWFSGLASGTGGIKVLIADTIVYKSEEGEKKMTGINQDEQRNTIIVSLYYNQSNGISMRLSVTTE